MIKIWGRTTSSNVQKVMWAVGEIGLPHERIDIGGPFGKNREPAYLAMNPNGLVPTLEEEDGFCCGNPTPSCAISPPSINRRCWSRPICASAPMPANGWTGSLSVAAPAIFAVFWGMIRTAAGKARSRGDRGIARRRPPRRSTMMDEQLGKTAYLAGDALLLRRYSGRHHGLSLSPAGARPAAVPQFRALVCGDLRAPGVQGSHRGGAADVSVVIPDAAKRESGIHRHCSRGLCRDDSARFAIMDSGLRPAAGPGMTNYSAAARAPPA